MTVNGATGASASAAQDAANGDLAALQATAQAAPGQSAARKAAVARHVQAARQNVQQLSAARQNVQQLSAAQPTGGQTGAITVTASAQADGTTITLAGPAPAHTVRRITRQVDIVTLRLEERRY